ncbi:hypothetical protein LSH36_457g04012 [Paralvinella palmiformis]|uniref:Coiled-coil-helix-coiled-coil-helix domain-containing protein 7 n=1 Tax=Paralvinella palmiformis TaxID=53620 RepID=A0AAD9JAS3_9ANNE|nr:hypothetical protein LSH36_457g04012 [Paralvinella palmiformis]
MSENNDEGANLRTRTKGKRAYTRVRNTDTNPCLKESEMSMECMSRNGYDRDKCYDYFMNYRSCLNFWKKIAKQRRLQGIKPEMPTPEERTGIWEDFLKNRTKK